MKKSNHFAMRQIIRKRQINTANISAHKDQQHYPSLMEVQLYKQHPYEHIIDRILKNTNKAVNSYACQLNMDEKYSIVQFMSEKENISYNRNTLARLMTVWRCPGVQALDNSMGRDQGSFEQRRIRNFFVLVGQVFVFQKIDKQQNQKEQKKQISSYDLIFQTQSKPKSVTTLIQGQQPKLTLGEYAVWGPLFGKRQTQNLNVILKLVNAIIVQLKQPQLQSMLINLGGMDQQKKIKIVQQFPVFSNISRKMLSILPYIELKKYTKNQSIYKTKQVPQAVYLILKGQIIFQVKIQIPKQRKQNLAKNTVNQLNLQTQTMSMGNYFGEQQIIFKSNRTVNTICNSAECDLLEIPLQKFQKLLGHSDFFEELKSAALIKINKRNEKIDRALQIYLEFNKSSQKFIQQLPEQQSQNNNISISNSNVNRKQSLRKKSTQPVRVMHGNIIKKISLNYNQPVNFSMLGANPDMYQATLKKFRKFTMKPAQKYKPDVNWDLKRVWKVLNLQSILREDTQVSSPQGRKFYQSHRRFQNHVQQVKSLRPKTSSSTYRTKLQYIAYLQQFNN